MSNGLSVLSISEYVRFIKCVNMEHDVIHHTRKTDTCYEKVLSSRDYIEGTGWVKEVLSQYWGALRYIGIRTCERKKKNSEKGSFA